MDDRTRILMEIVRQAYSNHITVMCPRNESLLSRMKLKFDDGEPKKGDLVLAVTSITPNPWFIGFLEEAKGNGNWIIRDIATNQLCNYSNESFVKISGLHKTQLWCGHERELYRKVRKAIGKLDYSTRYKDLDINGKEATVRLRDIFKNESKYIITFHWNTKTTIKSLVRLFQAYLDKAKEIKEYQNEALLGDDQRTVS